MLKFGIIKAVSEATGRCMAQYIANNGISFDNAEDALLFLNDVIGFTDEIKIVPGEEGTVEIRLHKDSCRMCPGHVGGLELPRPACPNLGFLKGYLEGPGLLKFEETYNIERGEMPVKFQDGYCVLTHQILERKA